MTQIIKAFTDGGARGNPGEAAIGGILYLASVPIHSFSKKIGFSTNNIAEYSAVIQAINWLVLSCPKANKIEFYLDSLLVVNQINRKWKIKQNHLIPYWQQVISGVSRLKQIGYECCIHHIPRSQNVQADRLVNLALDQVINAV